MTVRPGQVLGRHRLIERIAAGGMAEVFLARQEGPEGFRRSVAVKVVHPDQDDPDLLRALIDEARLSAQLSHPNVVQVIELGELDDSFYLVMEFLDGWPVDQLLKLARQAGEGAPLDAVVDLGQQLLDALGYAHHARDDRGQAMEVVHRDIKPSNLIVDGRGLLKVVDFGIARAASIERRTATGMGKGTPAYMAPEQLYGEETGPGADLYAVGVLLFELATGQRLFEADSLIALVGRRQQGYRDEDEAVLRATAPALVPLVRRALSREPEDRHASATEMGDALSELATVRARRGVRAWLDVLVGPDTASFRALTGELDLDPLPTGALAPAGTEVVDWQPSGAPGEPTVPSAGHPASEGGASTDRSVASAWRSSTDRSAASELPATRLQRVPDATVDEGDPTPAPVPRRWGWLLLLPVLAFGLFWARATPEESADPALVASAPSPTVSPADPLAAPSSSPSPTHAAPSPGATSPSGSTAVPSSGSTTSPPSSGSTTSPTSSGSTTSPPAPRPRRSPAPTAATVPAPTPRTSSGESPSPSSTPSPTPAPEAVAATAAPGTLFVNMVGQSGFVEVAGHGRRPTKRTFSLPPGAHRVQLLDLEGRQLSAFTVEIGTGQTSRCVWRKTATGLSFVPDPEGAPCALLPG